MTPAIIISRYNDPDINNRRRNVREAMALCRLAVANGYAPVCSLLHLADVNDPPEDTAGEVRDRVTEYSRTLARMVGAAGGVAIVPEWYASTDGMEADWYEWLYAQIGIGGGSKRVTLAEIEPYLPRDLVGQVQAAVDEIREYADEIPGTQVGRGLRWARAVVKKHTGVTPKEVE